VGERDTWGISARWPRPVRARTTRNCLRWHGSAKCCRAETVSHPWRPASTPCARLTLQTALPRRFAALQHGLRAGHSDRRGLETCHP